MQESIKKNIQLSIWLLTGAVKTMLVIVGVIAALITIFGIPFGGPLLLLYYWKGIVFYFVPGGLVVGAFAVILGPPSLFPNPRGAELHYSKMAYVIWIGFPLVVLIGVAAIPYLIFGVERNVVHGARWAVADEAGCETPVVILMLTEYSVYERICSPELRIYLDAKGEEIVPVTYRVTYDNGNPRSYQLIQVSNFTLTSSHWIGGAAGCGGEYTYPCDSPQAQRGSPLLESSWQDS